MPPSKLKKAMAAVKDQTSISLAKVKTTTTTITSSSTSAASLEVAILKATTHDEAPINDQQVHHILRVVSLNRSHASCCARALGRRITRTHNWAVALKSLLLVLRLFQDGDPHFPKEVLSAMKRGYKLLNLSSFSASSAGSSPWDFTAFVRTFALYLDERLHCFLTGKLVHRRPAPSQITLDMKPIMMLDRITHWQRLLDRAIGTRPTGSAKSNRLVQTCLYAVVQESFDLYRDISDGLALILDSFFHLQHASCLLAYEACVKASGQFEELSSYYDVCKNAAIGGRTSDYPSVMKMSEDLLHTLHDFLKDHNSPVSAKAASRSASHLLPSVSSRKSEDHRRQHTTSLEDLIGDVSWDAQVEDYKSYHSDPGDRIREKDASAADDQLSVVNDLASEMSDPSIYYSAPNLLEQMSLFKEYDQNVDDFSASERQLPSRSDGWEQALLEAASATHPSSSTTNSDSDNNLGGFEVDFDDGAPFVASSYNPFLQDSVMSNTPATASYVQPTFRADLHGNGNSSSVANGDLDYLESGGVVDLFGYSGNDNAGNSISSSGSFVANFGNARQSEVISNASVSTGLSLSDEFASLSVGSVI